MNQQLAAVNLDMSQYHRLILYIEYANETSAILNGEEVFTYFHDKLYNKVAMDIYNSHQANLYDIQGKLESTMKWMLSWLAFYLFWRFVFYIIRRIFKFASGKPIHIILTK
jgi:hypothetical protein